MRIVISIDASAEYPLDQPKCIGPMSSCDLNTTQFRDDCDFYDPDTGACCSTIAEKTALVKLCLKLKEEMKEKKLWLPT